MTDYLEGGSEPQLGKRPDSRWIPFVSVPNAGRGWNFVPLAPGLIATITDAQSNVTTYGYDSQGNRTSVTDALSHETTFAYDVMNALLQSRYLRAT